jgi:hypothetical protein
MCINSSTNDECLYLTQETNCMGPAPYKCQCQTGKFFNIENQKCETETTTSTLTTSISTSSTLTTLTSITSTTTSSMGK